MKRFAMLLLCAVMALTAAAQTDEARLTATVERLRLAMISGNRAELENIAADNLSYWHSSGKHQNKQEFVETLATKKSDFKTIELTNQTITISGKTALVHHDLFANTNDGGKPGTANLGILLVWQKVGNEWKLFARQAYPITTPKTN